VEIDGDGCWDQWRYVAFGPGGGQLEGDTMFERYTEKARRVIFFARYEASQFGSPYIESEHVLLGLLRRQSSDEPLFASHASV
jgi:ATP-dependent Clp protease ATP-binding subunit ClpC